MSDFTKKVAVITGGANGIGKCIAEEFKKRGAAVEVIDKAPGEHFVGDVADKAVLEKFAGYVIDRYGKVDYLINNALPLMKGLNECSYEAFQYALSVGVTAPFYLSKLFAPYFTRGGSIINISSSRDRMSQPQTESYTAAKGGVAALTHALAVSLAGKVRVNSISPGWIDTSYRVYEGPDAFQQPVGRVGNPLDIANTALFLCSDEAGFITGENICVDGGMTRLMIYHGDNGWALHDPCQTVCGNGLYIGADGCRGGWIAALLDHGSLRLERFETVRELVEKYPLFDSFLIDMAIGLKNSRTQHRPDESARKELRARAATVFSVPCRAAVYAESEEEQKAVNLLTLGKSLSKQTIHIIPKIKELDVFLTTRPEYKNKILESHPELDFARLNGAVLTSRKKEKNGIEERIGILNRYLCGVSRELLSENAKKLKCGADDILDAICLAVTASLAAHGLCETIPSDPEPDEKGLYMMLTAPQKNLAP